MTQQNHFLDSNIIIRAITPFGSLQDYYEYVSSTDKTKITTIRVFGEAKGYFNFTRQSILTFIEYAYTNNELFKPTNLDHQLLDKAKKFFKDPRDVSAIELLIQFRKQEIYDVVFGLYSQLEKFREEIANVFSFALLQLTVICANSVHAKVKRFDKCPKNYCNTGFEPIYQSVNNIINYEKDSLILLDAYYLKQLIDTKIGKENELLFISDDEEHILNNKGKLEKILKIEIFSFVQIKEKGNKVINVGNFKT